MNLYWTADLGSAVLIMTEVNSSVKSMDLKVQTGIKTEEIDSLSYKFFMG